MPRTLLPDVNVWLALFMIDPRVAYADEPEGIEERWRLFTKRQEFSPQVWNDAYLAAFAIVAQLELVTLDQGLSQYKPAVCTVLR